MVAVVMHHHTLCICILAVDKIFITISDLIAITPSILLLPALDLATVASEGCHLVVNFSCSLHVYACDVRVM